MHMKFILVLLVFSRFASAQLVDNYKYGHPNGVPNAVVNSVVAALYSFEKKNVPKNTISGTCVFREGPCNGAQIVLLKGNQEIFRTTLTSNASFLIPNLKKHEEYVLNLTWEKHKVSELKKVTTGEFIQIILTDKK